MQQNNNIESKESLTEAEPTTFVNNCFISKDAQSVDSTATIMKNDTPITSTLVYSTIAVSPIVALPLLVTPMVSAVPPSFANKIEAGLLSLSSEEYVSTVALPSLVAAELVLAGETSTMNNCSASTPIVTNVTMMLQYTITAIETFAPASADVSTINTGTQALVSMQNFLVLLSDLQSAAINLIMLSSIDKEQFNEWLCSLR